MAHRLTKQARPILRTAVAAMLLLLITVTAGCDKDAITKDARLPVEIDGHRFELELALTKSTRFQGLSDRESIAEDGGMLFAFNAPEKLSFVMRRCPVPIDIIFLDPGGRIVAMHEMQVEPDPYAPDHELRRYTSRWPAQFAIELKGGTLRELDLQAGDKIALPTDELRQLAE